MGASSMALRSTQTLISEGQGKATLRQNTTNGLRLMRSEVERSMNLLVTRTDPSERDDPEMDLMSNHAEAVSLCKTNAGSQGFQPIFGINMVELEEPVIYGVSLSIRTLLAGVVPVSCWTLTRRRIRLSSNTSRFRILFLFAMFDRICRYFCLSSVSLSSQ